MYWPCAPRTVIISLAVTGLAACLLVLIALGVAERLARDRAWRAVPIRVHINGSRGKSTVTRLVWSALRAAGIPALAKTTGTQPRLLLPDGSERALHRRAPASIREQLVLLRQARRLEARAVVVECMAIDPELQWVSERHMVRATIGAITNVRRDHEDMMGRELDAIAASLANTIPRRGVLVCGDERAAGLLAARASSVGTRLVLAATSADEKTSSPRWLAEDRATALAVTRALGVDDQTARRAFDAAPPDPGALSGGTTDTPDRPLSWLDATAANDPESLAQLVADSWRDERGAGAADGAPLPPPLALVYNHRADRGARLSTFTRHSREMREANIVIVTGDRPPLTAWLALRRARAPRPTAFVARRALALRLRTLPAASRLVFCGNTRSFAAEAVLREVSVHG
jgi:poly-gamma-glutamate synthase PgsB/CapB